MKKIAALAVVILAVGANAAMAQFYARAGIGYALPAAGQTISGSSLPYSGTSSASAYNMKSASFGAGVQGLLGLGYMVNRHVGVQLDAGIGIDGTTYSYTDQNVNVYYGSSPVASDVTIKLKAARPIMLMPSLVLQTGGDVWNGYCRMGVVLPLNTTIDEDKIYVNLPGTGAITNTDQKWKISNSFSLGFTAAAGLSYKINEKISVWGELSILSLSSYIKQETLDAYLYNGQNIDLSQITGTKTVYYNKSGNADTTGVHYPSYSQPFSNVGITVGIKFNLTEREPNPEKSSGKRERGYYE